MRGSTKKAAMVLAAATLGVAMAGQAQAAAVYTFAQTAGGTYNWNADNWAASGFFPNAIDDTANVNNNIIGNTTINLGSAAQTITVGSLNLGDSDGTNTFTVASGFAGNTLVFQSASSAATLSMTMGGTTHPVSTISAPISLQSPLTVDLGLNATATNSQYVNLNGNITTNGNNITLTNGYLAQKLSGAPVGNGTAYTSFAGQNAFNLNGDLIGSGTLTINSGGSLNLTQTTAAGLKSFNGKVVVNSGRGLNASGFYGSLMLNALGSLKNASEMEINGFTYAGTATPANNGYYFMGGSVNVGDNQGVNSNPGTRISSTKVTFNGGALALYGQRANTAVWTTASTDVVTDTVSTVNFNSGMAFITIVRDTSTAGTALHATTVQRSPGAGLFIGNADGTYATTKFLIDNGASLLVGGTGSTATNQPIIPWMMERFNNAGFKSPTGFVTYDATLGVKVIDTTTGYNSFAASTDATDNISSGSATISASRAINSLRVASGTITVNKGQVLTITSGALMLQGGTVTTASTGTGTDGTVDFGSREGIIWTNQTDSNFTMGARITGSGGLTKYGFTKLILTGNNAYTGQTYVSSGILQVGADATNTTTKLGDGDVHVAGGSILSILGTADVIANTASVYLDTYGPTSNGVLGQVNLGAGVNETVGGLYFGSTSQAAGTWGATGSGAANINDTYFTGGGILTVVPVPEPASLALMGIGALVLMRRRRH